ncbi:hypothetical protein GW17_00047543 [Ensete ventricosum]|nr:hypothetical protein GW17_00047543 [Ensete ventricosum]RZR82921.1 hypothetical protein BHM03_00009451 [Ensete ventricosum]
MRAVAQGKGLRRKEEMPSSRVLGEEEEPSAEIAGPNEEGNRRSRLLVEQWREGVAAGGGGEGVDRSIEFYD